MNTKTKILVVEDEAIIADDIHTTLVRLGYDVPMPAASGAEAIESAGVHRPDLVLMDIKLQGPLDGIETATLLREKYSVPVVYLTSHSDDATLTRAKTTQPYGYLIKPFTERDLRTTIEVAVHKHALEQHVADREHWFAATLQSLGDAVIATDSHERITFMNTVAEELTGHELEEVLGRPLGSVFALVNEKTGDPIESPIGAALRQGFATLPGDTALLRQGQPISIRDTATTILDRNGMVSGGVVVFRDITEQRELELRLCQSERLASLGALAASTAHEINNPLAYVVANVGIVAESLGDVVQRLQGTSVPPDLIAKLTELLDVANEAVEGAAHVHRIVHNLKRFGRSDQTFGNVLDLPDVIDSAVKMTGTLLRHHAHVVKRFGTTPHVRANEGQLVQVFVNLLMNAAQAIDEGRADQNEIRITTRTDDAGRAVVEVQDSGCGIAPHLIPRLFQPFFTTKPVGVGSGLGLSVCHGIVTSLNGEISVESHVGLGTTFRVALPPALTSASVPPPSLPEPSSAGRRGRVYVIDDDDAIVRAVSRLLSSEHDVMTETSPSAALEHLSSSDEYDLVLCDVTMPRMDGVELYHALEVVRPALAGKMVFMTGGALNAATERFLATALVDTIEKPFTPQWLRAFVRDHVNQLRTVDTASIGDTGSRG